MPTVIATHPLGWATVTSHPWDDAVASSEAEGYALDARVSALAGVLAPSVEVKAELVTLAQAIDGAALRESFGGRYTNLVLGWRAQQIGALRGHAARLGFDAEQLDIKLGDDHATTSAAAVER